MYCELCHTTDSKWWKVVTDVGVFCELCGSFSPEILREKLKRLKHNPDFELVELICDGENWHLAEKGSNNVR